MKTVAAVSDLGKKCYFGYYKNIGYKICILHIYNNLFNYIVG